jgi:hypothetical protein
MIDEPRQTGFSSCLWCDLIFGVRRDYIQNSGNYFVDVETFSDTAPEARFVPVKPSTVASIDGTSKAVVADEEASPKFIEDLERTMSQSGILLEDPSLVEENVCKLSSSELAKFSHFYESKTSIVGKVVSERLL